MTYLNLGILAHVDAGKTSLTERLLFTTGVIDELGSVDGGNTQTDSLVLERQRGITIKAAVASFVIGDVTVNLIDTPGHPDFIAEVERVLSVLDGVVLVISAVEGVQAQTRILMRALQRLRIPTLLFINKVDRRGAQIDQVVQSIAEKLSPAVLLMGTVHEAGTRSAAFLPSDHADPAFLARLVDLLAAHNQGLLAAYVQNDASISAPQLQHELAAQTKQALVHPIFCGSAITGAGVGELIAGIAGLLPASNADPHAAVAGTVFKIERGPANEKIAYVRMFAGTLHVRERLDFGQGSEQKAGKVTAISVFDGGPAMQRSTAKAGQIAKLTGLNSIQIGDAIGATHSGIARHWFAPPTLETMIVPQRSADRTALHAALARLAEQDPLINLRTDDLHGELFVSLYGEVQKEVIQATLANEVGIQVAFRETSMICVERPLGTGTAIEVLGKADNPFLATIGLQVEPAPLNTGISFQIQLKVETIPLYVYKSVEEFQGSIEAIIQDTLRQGLYGWHVTDCRVTMTASGYTAPATSARDFRLLLPLVLMRALQQAGTCVCEPLHAFHLEIPAAALGPILPVLARLRAIPEAPSMRGSACVVQGSIPASQVHALQQQLPALTHGEGVLESSFERYEAIRGSFPTRPRTDNNPLNRKEYLLHVLRRV